MKEDVYGAFQKKGSGSIVEPDKTGKHSKHRKVAA